MAVFITQGLPIESTDVASNVTTLRSCFQGLIDELNWALTHLDAGNVLEAASIKAQNIDVSQAKIQSAQIQNLIADKIAAGIINTDIITIKSKGSNSSYMQIQGNRLEVYEDGTKRLDMGIDGNGVFTFTLFNEQEEEQLYFDSNGNAIFEGNLLGSTITSAEITGGKITGAEITGGTIKSDTTIDVTTDLSVGETINLKHDGVTGGTIEISENTPPTLTVKSLGSRALYLVKTGSGGTSSIELQNSSITIDPANDVLAKGTWNFDKIPSFGGYGLSGDVNYRTADNTVGTLAFVNGILTAKYP